MVGDRKASARTIVVALALSAVAPACNRGATDGVGQPGGKPGDCKPPSEEKLAESIRLQSEGVELYRKKQADAAMAKFEAALRLNPCDVSLFNDLGIAFHQQKKVKQALDYLNKGVELDPLYPLTYLNLGIVHDELANFDDAVKALKEFTRLSPDFAEAHRRLGGVYFKMSRYDDARQSMERAVSLKPDDWEAWYTLGSIAFHQEDFAKASEYYAKTLELNPNYSEALYKQGSALQRLGRESEASVFLEKFKKLSVHQERIDEIQRLLSSESDRKHDLYLALGLETMQVGLFDEAIDSFQKSIKHKADHVPAWVGLADALRRQKKYDASLEAANKAKELDPTSVPAAESVMAAFSEQGKYDLAIAEVRALLDKKPDYTDGWVNLGLLEQRRGNYGDAIPALEKAIAVKPDNLVATEVLLSIYTEAPDAKYQNKKKALELAQGAEQMGSRQFEFLAEAYHMNGDLPRAMALLEQGLQDPNHPMAETMKTHLEKIRIEAKGK